MKETCMEFRIEAMESDLSDLGETINENVTVDDHINDILREKCRPPTKQYGIVQDVKTWKRHRD